jgi:hypothetical protein
VKALFFLLAMLVGFTPAAAGAAPRQMLSIVLNSESASTQRLPHYRAAAPIAVRVAGDARKFDAMTVTATGPDGTAIRAPLARTGAGFEGALRLVTPGAWRIGLTTQLGSVSDAIADVSLDVEPAHGSQRAGYLAMALAALLLAAGVLVLARRDLLATALAAVVPTKRS